jgi:hypothetical protein
MTSTEHASTKRRKISPSSDVSIISDLPSEPLIQISSYLKPLSRALFTVAIAEQPDDESLSQDVVASAIVGDDWDTLDFGEIEKELAAKLSDADISGVLRCVNARKKVKKLRLTNCVGITGSCLEPLQDSWNIEVIDLSLVGDHESPVLDPEPLLSCDAALPILEGIVGRLKLIRFPKVWLQRVASDDWRGWRTIDNDVFNLFLGRYSDSLENRYYSGYVHYQKHCQHCGENVHPGPYMEYCQHRGMFQEICYGCLKNYHDSCNDDEEGAHTLKFCSYCEQYYCEECCAMDTCNRCGKHSCVDCTTLFPCYGCDDKGVCKDCQIQCDVCNGTSCTDCRNVQGYAVMDCKTCNRTLCGNCVSDFTCDKCAKGGCRDCSEKEDPDGVKYCKDCGEHFCSSCRLRDFTEHGYECSTCFEIISAAFDHIKEMHRRSSQNETK